MLEEDDNLGKWVESLARGSVLTASVYFRRVGHLCASMRVTPAAVAAMSVKEGRAFIHDLISFLEGSGNVGSTIEGYVKAVRNWMTWNDLQIPGRIKVFGSSENPTVEDEVTPVTGELRKILEVATLRGKVTCSMMAFGAFRPEVFGTFMGDEGLRVGDLPEMEVERVTDAKGEVVDGKVTFGTVPALVVVRKPLSKMGHQYFGFLPEEGCRYLDKRHQQLLQPDQHPARNRLGRLLRDSASEEEANSGQACLGDDWRTGLVKGDSFVARRNFASQREAFGEGLPRLGGGGRIAPLGPGFTGVCGFAPSPAPSYACLAPGDWSPWMGHDSDGHGTGRVAHQIQAPL